MLEALSPEQPQIARGVYIRAIGRMTAYLSEVPTIPALPSLTGTYTEVLHDLTGQVIDTSPGSVALKGLRYSFLKLIEEHHQRYSLSDDATPETVHYRYLDESAFSNDRPYVGVRNAILGGQLVGWQHLTYSREWPRVTRLLDLNDEIIPLDPTSKMTPQPLRAAGLAVGADSSFEGSAAAFATALASYHSQEQYPMLKDDPDQMYQIALDLSDWNISRGYRPFQPIFMGRQALSYINFGALRLRDRRHKWMLSHDGSLNNSHPNDPPIVSPHIGCIVGIQALEQEAEDEAHLEAPAGLVTDLHRIAWASINANVRARTTYNWETARKTWHNHPRRTLSGAAYKRFMALQHQHGSPAVGDASTELLNYHLECHKWV